LHHQHGFREKEPAVTVYYPTFKPVVNPLTMVTQVLELPMAGEVLKRVGNRVEPDEVVARTLVPARGQRFAVARELGIAPKSLAAGVVLEDEADIEVGDVLVRVGRLRQRVWRAPIAGTLSHDEVEQGYLVITPDSENYERRVHIKGFVIAVEPYRSITIQTPAALVQGAFGFGLEQHGVLRAAVTDERDELLPEMLDERSALSILVGGGPVGADALARAVELRVRGLIVGSITEEALRTFLGYRGDADWTVGGNGWDVPPATAGRDFPLTLVVTEGFGHRPMNSPAFELLTSYAGSEAAINGQTWLHGPERCRPQVIIPLTRADPAEIPPEEEAERLGVGVAVRLLKDDLLGQVGLIVGFPRRMQTLGCGVRYRVAEVHLPDGQDVMVPLENLEVLGAGGKGY
jgi:hypothetical protein